MFTSQTKQSLKWLCDLTMAKIPNKPSDFIFPVKSRLHEVTPALYVRLEACCCQQNIYIEIV